MLTGRLRGRGGGAISRLRLGALRRASRHQLHAMMQAERADMIRFFLLQNRAGKVRPAAGGRGGTQTDWQQLHAYPAGCCMGGAWCWSVAGLPGAAAAAGRRLLVGGGGADGVGLPPSVQTRLAKYYTPLSDQEKRRTEEDVYRLIVNRDSKFTNFLEVRGVVGRGGPGRRCSGQGRGCTHRHASRPRWCLGLATGGPELWVQAQLAWAG